jgi:hypothetical protein
MNALGVHACIVATEDLELFDRTQLQKLPREIECAFVCVREREREREREKVITYDDGERWKKHSDCSTAQISTMRNAEVQHFSDS